MPSLAAEVLGLNLDPQTRCAHYHGPSDIISIKMKCCGIYYACKDCHEALAAILLKSGPRPIGTTKPFFAAPAAPS
ncbi:MAG TPA: CHY zinc finger protein [Candidatus Acidoferrum sp.]